MFKDESGGKIITEFVALRAKTYAYLMEDGSEHKKCNGTERRVMEQEIMFKNYKDFLLNNEIILKSQKRFRSDHHRVYAEEVNKIVLSSNDDEILQTFNKIKTYSRGTNAFNVWKSKMRDYFVKKYAGCPFYDEILLQQN